MQHPAVQPKLFMLLLGSKAPARNVEQHDYFFSIAHNLKELVPEIKAFWPEAGSSLHIDGWREVNAVDGYEIKVIPKADADNNVPAKLFFINLGGYLPGNLAETHHIMLTVQDDRGLAVQHAKKTPFFKTNTVTGAKGANSHIDEKYAFDVDEIYKIEDILTPLQKQIYHIAITKQEGLPEDKIHLGYFKLDKI